MQFSFDHLVWFLRKPEEALAPLENIGIHTVNGGRHKTWGTYNTLTYFGLSYIEFLGIENLLIAEKHKENRLITHIVKQLPKENGEGPARIAIRTDDIEKLAVKLKEEGFTVYGPIPGERVRTDGQVIRWSLLFTEIASNHHSLPFFIQWEKSDDERFKELEEQGVLGKHTLGHPGFDSVGIAVYNLDHTVSTWEKLLNRHLSVEFINLTINARCRTLDLQGAKLLFCTPLGDGPVDQVLKERGETPFLVNLNATNQNRFFKMLNGCWIFQ
ncbi:VOC family protein [Neobacillus drentensis]|uniref:VOC family protein n=1 Tax=Neobacillus drentensis TaxID=220684 RepID=UPI002FFFBA4A